MRPKSLKNLIQFSVASSRAADFCAFSASHLPILNTLGYILNSMRAIEGNNYPFPSSFLLCTSYDVRAVSPVGTFALKHDYEAHNTHGSESGFLTLSLFLF